MKILFTAEFYYPFTGGIQEVARQVMGHLVSLGHDVTLATSYLPNRQGQETDGIKIRQFKISGNETTGLSGEVEEYKKFLLDYSGDAMVNFAINCWPTDIALQVLPQLKYKKILSTPGFSTLRNPKYAGFYKDLAPRLKVYDRLVFTSANYQDYLWAAKAGLEPKSIVIPNGASKEEFLALPGWSFKEKYGIKTKNLCLSVSTHYRDKGHGFVISAFRKMKRKDATLVIVGNLPPGLSKYRGCFPLCWLKSKIFPNVVLVPGGDRETVLAAYKEADLFLFGSRLECSPLVMYESFASKALFISTDVGNVTDYRDVIKIIRTPDEMAQTANHYLDNPSESLALVTDAFGFWQKNYTWDNIAGQYERIIKLKD